MKPNRFTSSILALSLMALALPSQAALSNKQLAKSLTYLKSPQQEKRQAAYKAFHELGEEEAENFQKVLNAAKKHHQKILDSQLKRKSSNPYNSFSPLADQLQSQREETMKLILTDYKKDASKIDKVMKAWEEVESTFNKARKLTSSDIATFDRKVFLSLKALSEIEHELRTITADDPDDVSDSDEILDELVEASEELKSLSAQRAQFQQFAAEVDQLNKITESNKEAKWAKKPHKQFAAILNQGRAVMGLRPLSIEEKLSDASRGHSEDMESHGFFAHESPVPGKKSPSDRARMANFRGSFTGENIAMGYNGPEGNYLGWFYSDGHRFNLFAKNPNTLGIGYSGKYWTMMTGHR